MSAPALTERFTSAVDEARRLHAGDVRKGSDTPYLSHLLAVAATVLEAGGDEEQAMAALLHDAAEDHGGRARLRQIERDFGGRVAGIVAACSDALPDEGEAKEPWWVRKARYLDHLADLPADALPVVAADKLANLRSTISDHAVLGEALWGRFNREIEADDLTRRDGLLWYHRRVVEALVPQLRAAGLDGLAGDLARAGAELRDRVVADPGSNTDAAGLDERFCRAEDRAARLGVGPG